MKKFLIVFISLVLGVTIAMGVWHGITYKDKIKVFAEDTWDHVKSAFKKSNEKPQDEQEPQEEQDPAYFGYWGENLSESELRIYGFSKSDITVSEGFIKNEVIYAKDMPNSGYACSEKIDDQEQTISFVWAKDNNNDVAFVYDIAKDEMSLANGTKLVRLENVENHVTDSSCKYVWTITKAATCQENGSRHGICSICGHEKDEVFLSGLHEFEYEKISNSLYKRVCSLCGYSDIWADTTTTVQS